MASVTAVEKELTELTKCKRKSKEAHGIYAARLLEEVQKLDDGDWEKLSPAVQEWCNAATRAVKANTEIPEFVDKKDDAPRERVADEKKEDDGAKAATAETNGAKAPAAKKEKKEKVEKPKGPSRDRGITTTIKKLLIKDVKTTTADLMKALESDGHKPSPSTVQTVRTDFIHSLRVLNDAGLTKVALD